MVNFRSLYPFKSNYIDIKGFLYHYLDEGSGEPLVMIHGNPTWSFYFRNLITAFSSQFRIIAPDHIGCGLSDKPNPSQYDYRVKSRVDDLETLLDHLHIKENITLVLHDWGGIIGMAYALRYPERIGRLILLNTAAFFPPGKKRLPFRLWLIRDVIFFAKLAVLGLNLFAWGALYMASHKRLSKEIKAGLIAPYNTPKNRIATLRFVQDIPINSGDPSYNQVKYIDENLHYLSHLPMLICWGKHDFVFDLDYLAEWQRRFPHAEAHVFEDAAHYVLEDAPDKIIACMKEFFKKHNLIKICDKT